MSLSLLDPLSHALAALIAAAHAALTSLGATSTSGAVWLLCIATVVVAVRLTLLPLVAHGVRLAHASARARPHLQELAERYKDRKDPDSIRQHMEERRRISAEHGVSRLGCLPTLIQLPIWLSLYHLLADVAAGAPVGAMSSQLVASLGAATLLGVPLAERGYLGAGPGHFAVVAGMAAVAAALSYVTQKYLVAPNSLTEGLSGPFATAQQIVPTLSAAGLLMAGGVVPVALLAYWVCNSAWTFGQQAVIYRWFPTPGSRAAAHADRRAVASG